jgi:hypothetical protein
MQPPGQPESVPAHTPPACSTLLPHARFACHHHCSSAHTLAHPTPQANDCAILILKYGWKYELLKNLNKEQADDLLYNMQLKAGHIKESNSAPATTTATTSAAASDGMGDTETEAEETVAPTTAGGRGRAARK